MTKKKLKVLDLFAGTRSVARAAERAGYETFSVELDEQHEGIDLYANILDVTPEMIIEKFGVPDVIHGSPPCQSFSVAAIGKNWTKHPDGNVTPKHERAELGMKLVQHTLWLIKELNPKVWYIENPRGMLRKMPFMQEFNRYTVGYCQYGDTRQKPTDIWSSHSGIPFKPLCKPGSPCHVAAPRGSSTGTQGIKNVVDRSRIPDELCDFMIESAEKIIEEGDE